MLKNERGSIYINWAIAIIVVLILAAIIIRVWVGENGLSQQKRDQEARNQTERNIIIEITNGTNY